MHVNSRELETGTAQNLKYSLRKGALVPSMVLLVHSAVTAKLLCFWGTLLSGGTMLKGALVPSMV